MCAVKKRYRRLVLLTTVAYSTDYRSISGRKRLSRVENAKQMPAKPLEAWNEGINIYNRDNSENGDEGAEVFERFRQ